MSHLDEKTERIDLRTASRARSESGQPESFPEEHAPKDRQLFTLEVLSKLAQQYSSQPDFKDLIEYLLQTLSEQFTAPDTFAVLQHPFFPGVEHNYFGTGSYLNNDFLKSMKITIEHCNYFLKNKGPQRVKDLDLRGRSASLGFMLAESNVELITPLLHNNNVIGLIGLGANANKSDYEEYQLDRLDALVFAIVPFIVNSFRFTEISNLFKWGQDLIDNIRQGVFVFDKNDLLKKINTPGFKILRSFKPNVPSIDSLYRVNINLIFPEGIYPGLIQRMNLAKNSDNYEYAGILRAGSGPNQKLYNLYLGQTSGKSGEETDRVITLEDITSQKNSEQRFLEVETLAQKAALVASMSEKLVRVLNTIQGGLELIRSASDKGGRTNSEAFLGSLEEKLLEIEQVCAFLRAGSNLAPRKKLVNLNSIIDEVLTFVKVQERFKRTSIAKKLDPALSELEMDPDQIALLILQLLKNAADAVNESQKESGEVIVKTHGQDQQLIVSISDNGTGLKPGVREKLFKTHCTTKGEGQGWSLFTCSKILDNHNCQVEIDSIEGKGVTFKLIFPTGHQNLSLIEKDLDSIEGWQPDS
jgi:signal transduction histidine kinase